VGSLDFIDVLVPMLPFLNHYGPLEGQYAEVAAHVPKWLLMTDATAANSYFLGQESALAPANLVPWLRPLAWWGAFVFALCAVMGGLNLLFRKQWTEHEKLAYPVIQLPIQLATAARALFTSRLFWLAFGLAAALDLLNGLNFLFPLLPRIPLVHVVNLQQFFPERPWHDMGWTPVSFYPFAIGMCFFMPLDLAFSCWFFFLFWKLERVLASHIGVHGMPGFPFVEEQTSGGYYGVALLALWISRRHLMHMGALLTGIRGGNATPWERIEARIAAALIVLGAGFLVWFSCRAGMECPVVLVFFILYFLISIAITRMRAELGHPSHDLHFAGPNLQIIECFGASGLQRTAPGTLAMLSFYHWFNRAYRGHPMPHGMEGFRIAERLKMDNARLLIAMGAAVAAGTVCAFGALLLVLNKHGATQVSGLGEWFGREAWTYGQRYFTAPAPRQPYPTYAILVGTLSSLGLAALRMNLAWWPLHPVGFAVSGSWSMEQLWTSIFTAWLIKALLLKYGGAKVYKPAVPFFLGLIMGDFIMGSFWNLYGSIMNVPVYHFWPY